MRILVFCQYYYPENFQITPICEEIAKIGNDVTVITGLPNYPTGIIPNEYKKGRRSEIINGVRVIRVNEHARKKGIFHLALNYLSYWINANMKIKKLKKEFDVIFIYQLSPVMMGLPALKYKKIYNTPIITYVCDLWPESMKMYIKNDNNIVFRYFKKLSYKLYSNSNELLCQSPTFIDYLSNYHHIDKKKIDYLPAFADDSYLSQDFNYDNGVIDFVFLGNLGKAQNLINVLEAIKMIKNTPGFRVHFVGDGSFINEMKKFVQINKMEEIVLFYGRKPVEEMPHFYKLADACLVSLKSDSAVGWTLPSKVQGYMAAGKPIFGMIEGSTKNIVEESKSGLCVPPNNIKEFAYLLNDFIINTEKYKDFGKNGREYFKNNFRKDIFMNKLIFYLEKQGNHNEQ